MTSPPVDDPETLRYILHQAEALFLDFDGPICDVFAGLPPQVVVDQLCVVLADGGYGDPPPAVAKSSDPFDVLKYAVTLGKTEARYVEAAFTAHEVDAIAVAEPTLGADALMYAWSQSGRPLAIVSNNSATAIEAYIHLHDLGEFVTYVSARTEPDVELLKPSPHLLAKAAKVLGITTQSVSFVGDSVTDIQAAHSAQSTSIGYANKAGKIAAMTSTDVQTIVTSIELLTAVVSSGA